MKKVYTQAAWLSLFLIVFSLVVNTGCVSVVESASGKEAQEPLSESVNFINDPADVKNLVTDDDKLVINYYDAYIWTVFFNEDNTVKSMVYAYNFESETEAQNMLETRKNELLKNQNMIITAAYTAGNYVVIELTDSSFDNLSRDILENNFNGLIVK